jgi:hypothetical protein
MAIGTICGRKDSRPPQNDEGDMKLERELERRNENEFSSPQIQCIEIGREIMPIISAYKMIKICLIDELPSIEMV